MRDDIISISDVDLRFAAGPWPMPELLRASVAKRWANMLEVNPHLWDGRILGVCDVQIDQQGVLRGTGREDAYSAFLTWREAGFPEMGIRNLFGSALILSRDGFVVLGIMGGDTANAGRVYPPGGSLEPRDVRSDGRIDLFGSIALELTEETGLSVNDARIGSRFAIFDGPSISVAQALHFDCDHAELLTRIRLNLESQSHQELADVVAVRCLDDAVRVGEVPPYAKTLLSAFSSGAMAL